MSLRDELNAIADGLNDDELEALVRKARKLRDGVLKHGHLNLDTDPRDFGGKELREELDDASWYLTFDAMRKERRAAAIRASVHQSLEAARAARKEEP